MSILYITHRFCMDSVYVRMVRLHNLLFCAILQASFIVYLGGLATGRSSKNCCVGLAASDVVTGSQSHTKNKVSKTKRVSNVKNLSG